MKGWIIAIIIIVAGFFFVKYAMPDTYTGFMTDISRLSPNFATVISQNNTPASASTQSPSYEINCLAAVNNDIDIYNQKHSGSSYTSVYKFQSFDNKDDAQSFGQQWSSAGYKGVPVLDLPSMNLPVAIIVVQIHAGGAIIGDLPVVCSDGKIGDWSNIWLSM